MMYPDTRTEKVIERLEVVAERMEKVAQALSDDMDTEEAEQLILRKVVRDAQGRAAKGRPGRASDEDGGGDG